MGKKRVRRKSVRKRQKIVKIGSVHAYEFK
jgi:hypothetical protein